MTTDKPTVTEARDLAQFFFEMGFGACYAEAIVRNGNKVPFPLSDAEIERQWAISQEAYDDHAELDEMLALASGRHCSQETARSADVGRECAARASRTDANDPQDCDWPVCGCDPLANKVIEALDERGNHDAVRAALEWYGEQARLARLVHSGGDAGRHALADDGGKRARAALTTPPADDGQITLNDTDAALIEGLRQDAFCDAPGPSGRKCGKCYRCLRRRAADRIEALLKCSTSGEVRALREALEKAQALLECIEQRSHDNCWWVNATDPETAVCDTLGAVEAALGRAQQ